VSLRHLKHVSSKRQIALIASIILVCAAGARADKIDLTITSATFSATCVGGLSTCIEEVNGSLLYDTATETVTDVSMQVRGTLSADLVPGPVPHCLSEGCLTGPFYDSGALSFDDPIEFGLALNLSAISAAPNTPSPVSLVGLLPGNPTLLYVPAACGGDQPNCDTLGAFQAAMTPTTCSCRGPIHRWTKPARSPVQSFSQRELRCLDY
jgi:hypothetical protein